MVLGKLDPYLIIYTNINSKCIKDLNLRLETVKALGKNIAGKFIDIVLDNNFEHLVRSEGSKTKNKWNCIKLKRFCTAKETKMKRQSIEWEKIFENYIYNKGLISKICNKLRYLSKNRQKTKPKQITQLKIGKMIWKDIFLKETYK